MVVASDESREVAMRVSKDQIDEILLKYQFKKEGLLPILLEVQALSDQKYITSESSRYIADCVHIPYSQFYEVFTFFSALNHEEKGCYHIEMCDSTVCRVNQKGPVEHYLEQALNIKAGETTKDKMFTLDYAPCFGACDTSPSVRINKKVYGNLTADKMKKILEHLKGVQHD